MLDPKALAVVVAALLGMPTLVAMLWLHLPGDSAPAVIGGQYFVEGLLVGSFFASSAAVQHGIPHRRMAPVAVAAAATMPLAGALVSAAMGELGSYEHAGVGALVVAASALYVTLWVPRAGPLAATVAATGPSPVELAARRLSADAGEGSEAAILKHPEQLPQPAPAERSVASACRTALAAALVLAQLSFSTFFGVVLFPGQSPLGMMGLCAAYPVCILLFKFQALRLLGPTSLMQRYLSFASLIAASLPYRFIFFLVPDWSTIGLIWSVELFYKVVVYVLQAELRVARQLRERLQLRAGGRALVALLDRLQHAASDDAEADDNSAVELQDYYDSNKSIEFYVQSSCDVVNPLVVVLTALAVRTTELTTDMPGLAHMGSDDWTRVLGTLLAGVGVSLALAGVLPRVMRSALGKRAFHPTQHGFGMLRAGLQFPLIVQTLVLLTMLATQRVSTASV